MVVKRIRYFMAYSSFVNLSFYHATICFDKIGRTAEEEMLISFLFDLSKIHICLFICPCNLYWLCFLCLVVLVCALTVLLVLGMVHDHVVSGTL